MPACFALVVAAYSLLLRESLAFLGRYRSPVAFGPTVEGLPDLVPQSSLPHFLRDDCAAVLVPVYPPPAAL